jgi:hypothetical protein
MEQVLAAQVVRRLGAYATHLPAKSVDASADETATVPTEAADKNKKVDSSVPATSGTE